MKQLLLSFSILALFSFSPDSRHTAVEKNTCPVCKSHKDVIPIIYGKPATALIEKAQRGECKLGGCVLDKNSPRFHCKKDKMDF